MAGKFNSTSANFLKLLYQAVNWSLVADNTATTPLTNIYWGLATAAPTVSSDQTSSEATYTSYARVAVARTTSGHTISGQSISPAANVSFPAATGGTNTISYATTGSATSGADQGFHYGTVTPNISVTSGVTPILTTASTITES